MLVAFLVARGVMISVFDNVYHFGTPIDRPEFARNLWLPTPLRLLILNMNLHRVIMRDRRCPGGRCRRSSAQRDRYDAPLLRTALAQFAGPVAISQLPRIDLR